MGNNLQTAWGRARGTGLVSVEYTFTGDAAHSAFAQINPVESKPDQYRGEPYVLAGDVYSGAPHIGRAGWTWYTGSSAWLYRVGLDDIL